MLIFKTKIDKHGNVESYINKPVVDKFASEIDFTKPIVELNPQSKIIGVITEAIELEDCFELTIKIWKNPIKFKIRREFIGENLMSIVIKEKLF